MPTLRQRIVPCLWFDNEGEQAARFYIDLFPDSRITKIARYGEAGHEIHGRPAGSVMTVAFELGGQPFTALNGGPVFQFNEAISFQVECDTQAEIDRYWYALNEGGDPTAQQCGWLKDRYGVSWQIVPRMLADWVADPESPKAQRAMNAMLKMKKLEIDLLRRAYEGV